MRKALLVVGILIVVYAVYTVAFSAGLFGMLSNRVSQSIGPCAGWSAYVDTLNPINAEIDRMIRAGGGEWLTPEEYEAQARQYKQLAQTISEIEVPSAVQEVHDLTLTLIGQMERGVTALAKRDLSTATEALDAASDTWKQRSAELRNASKQCNAPTPVSRSASP